MILGLVRARNEARWIGRCIASLRLLCDAIIVMDDNSADDTAEIAHENNAHVLATPFTDFNETRDKNWLYDTAMQAFPGHQWVVMLDGDEELTANAATTIGRACDWGSRSESFRLPIQYLWNREDQIRVDGIYRNFTRPSIWRVMPGQRFVSPYPATGLHCGNTPAGLACATLDAPVLHYGYIYREDRLRKLKYYNELDPNNVFEDRYAHMVIGDDKEHPATMKTKWAGPLELAPL